MATTLSTAIQITDGFSPAFKSMRNALSVVMSTLADVQNQLGKPVDLSTLAKAQTDLMRTSNEFDSMRSDLVATQQATGGLSSAMGGLGSSVADAQSNLKGAANAVNVLGDSATATKVDLQGASVSANQFENALDVISKAANGTNTNVKKAATAVDQLGAEAVDSANQQAKLTNEMKKGSSAATELIGKLKGLVAGYLSFQGIKTLIDMSDTYTNIKSRLDLMNDGLQTTDELMKMVRESSNRTYSSFSQTADAVGRLGVQASAAFSNSQDIVNFAEQINKHLAISGSQGAAAEGAMTQLVQAMSNGVLRGEELNSVLDGMPTVANTIAKYMKDMYKGNSAYDGFGIKDFAEKGLITAEVVKAALYSTADETNKKFAEMGVTFSDVWNVFRNSADEALESTYKYLGRISNSESFQNMARAAGSAFAMLGSAIVGVLDIASSLYGFISSNWSLIAPVVGTITAAVAAYAAAQLYLTTVTKIQAIAESISAARKAASAAATALATGATFAQTAAQYGLNAALWACPLTWIVAGIIAVVGVLYLAVAAVNKFAGTSISATGIIVGAFTGLYAIVYNIVASLMNYFAIFIEFLTNAFKHPIYSIKALFINLGVNFLDNCIAMTKGWDGFATALANAMISAINFAIKAWNKLIDLLPDTVKSVLGLGKGEELTYSTSITSDLTTARDQLKGMLGDKPEDYVTTNRIEYKNVGEYAKSGYSVGEKFGESVADALTFTVPTATTAKEQTAAQMVANANATPQTAKGYGTQLGQIVKNTSDTAKNTYGLAANDEELKYMRELGEREAVNKFTTAEIKLDVKNNNSISNSMDIDDVVRALTSKLSGAVSTFAEGSHVGG